jgi:hypothetical protein
MKRKPKCLAKIKVAICAEFACPFFHAGHMGTIMCQAMTPKKDIARSEENNPPPGWCPLRVGVVKVSF